MTAVVESVESSAAFADPAGRPSMEIRRPVRISANLLPSEVVADRRLTALKRRLVFGLVALVVVLGAGYGYSRWQTSQAAQILRGEQIRATDLLNQQASYTPLVTVQADLAGVQGQLATVMADDMDWSQLFGVLSQSAPRGVSLTGVTGAVTGADTSSSSTDYSQVLNRSGSSTVGTVAVSGTAPSKEAVAAYVDALAKVRGFTGAYPSSVIGDRASWTFTVNVQLTNSVLHGRYTPAADATSAATGGS
jgi:Tfp pilus assembly protein PilN